MKTKTDELNEHLFAKLSGSWGVITHALIPGVGIIKFLKYGGAKLLKGKKIKDRGIEIEIKKANDKL
jgi:hypothetical protein